MQSEDLSKNRLWETDSFIDENTLTVNIARLRKKLEQHGLAGFISTKVGMSKREIRQSINSQVLTVFFLSLAAAGVHMLFAFPIISGMLRVFGMNDVSLFAVVTLVCFGVFALFYTAAYFITSRSYYKIAAMGDD